MDLDISKIKANFHTHPRKEIVAHDGLGRIEFERIFKSEHFRTECHFVGYAVMPPGSSVGLHEHPDTEEFYMILSGSGEMAVNDQLFRVTAGDIVLNPLGGTHSLNNDGDANLEMLVVEIGLAKSAA